MPQEDYLKKQFDRLARALAKVLANLLGLKYSVDIDRDIEIITEINDPQLGLNLPQIMDLPNDHFIDQLKDKHFNNESLEVLADIFLFIVENSSDREQNKEKRKMLAEKCNLIWQYLEKTEATYSFDWHLKMDRIKMYLN